MKEVDIEELKLNMIRNAKVQQVGIPQLQSNLTRIAKF
jgi:hypothetical protein